MPKPMGAKPGQEERQVKADAKTDVKTDVRQDNQPNQNLTVRYGKIGIPAVAAALLYRDAGRNPAYAPVVPRNDHRLLEAAA